MRTFYEKNNQNCQVFLFTAAVRVVFVARRQRIDTRAARNPARAAEHCQPVSVTWNQCCRINLQGKTVWLGSVVVRALDLRSTGREFTSRPPRYRMHPWASCSHTCASVTKQYNLVLEQAGKVTVGLASHWPCVTDNNGCCWCPVDWSLFVHISNVHVHSTIAKEKTITNEV